MKRILVIEWNAPEDLEREDTLPLAFIGGLRDQARRWFEDNGRRCSVTVLHEMPGNGNEMHEPPIIDP